MRERERGREKRRVMFLGGNSDPDGSYKPKEKL